MGTLYLKGKGGRSRTVGGKMKDRETQSEEIHGIYLPLYCNKQENTDRIE